MFPGKTYSPPGAYTKTSFESPVAGGLDSFKLAVIVGEGNESLVQTDLQMVRGSSSTEDQRVAEEDETGRAVVSVSLAGVVTLGAFDGVMDKIQVRHFPVVTGAGAGATSNNRSDVSVTINGKPIVVRSLVGAKGIVQLAQAPLANDIVRITYFFKRTDTLVIDDVSDQVPNRQATVRALSGIADVAVGGTSVIDISDAAFNSGLILIVDGVQYALAIPFKSDYTMTQIATAITAFGVGTLTAGTFVNQYGQSALILSSDHSLSIGAGSANGVLGLVSGLADNRTSTFYTFNGPIVDGSNGGVTATDLSHVTVKVNNKQVIASSVNGTTRAVTLAKAPKAGSVVTIQYYFNTWQDTWDYLAHIGVTSVTRCGEVQGGRGFTQGADFILQDDKILWGTATTTVNGSTTVGSVLFGENQIAATLVDEHTFLAECTPSVSQSGGIASETMYDFVLPFQPTLGNGRNTPLGQSLFQTVSNGRIDLPVNRPDVVWAYWGFDINDAMSRGRVDVTKVEDTVFTLASPVPVGAKVYATFYYNTLTDEAYTVSVANPGVSGVGTYTVQNSGQEDVLAPTYAASTKGAGLTGITVEFPSGSELSSDVRFEVPMDTDNFTGPVEEVVTVQFAAREKSPGRFTFPGHGPYEFIPGKSDHLAVVAHSVAIPDTSGMDLSSPASATGHANGYFACLVSDEIVYEGNPGSVAPGAGYAIDGEAFVLEIDGVNVPVKTGTSDTATIVNFAAAINQAAGGFYSVLPVQGVPSATAIELTPGDTIGTAAKYNDYYKGWVIVFGKDPTVPGNEGLSSTVTSFVASTSIITVDPAFSGVGTAADKYYMYNPATRAALVGTTKFDGPISTAENKLDKLSWVYHGGTSGATAVQVADLGNGPFASPNDLANAVTAAMKVNTDALADTFAGLVVKCTANGDGQLQFKLQLSGNDSVGYLQFVRNANSDVRDFGILAGLVGSDTAQSGGASSTTLIQGPVAWVKTCTGGDQLYDRLLIRNRILPGKSGALAPDKFVATEAVKVKSASVHAGLAIGMTSPSGSSAAVHPATIVGSISLMNGQDTSGDYQPHVTFYNGAAKGHAANNVMNLEIDGHPVTVTFPANANGSATPIVLGPMSGALGGLNILDQVITAIYEADNSHPFGNYLDIANVLVRQEGCGVRISSGRTDSLSKVAITGGSAISVLGFSAGSVVHRTLTEPKQIAAAMMSDVETTFNTWITTPSSSHTGHFAKYAIATSKFNETGAEFLYIQDLPATNDLLGTVSNISVNNTDSDLANALRYTTGLGAIAGDGGVGDSAMSGFFVQSSDTVTGSGTVNKSMLSSDGTGQDGVVGQTYRDAVTGLTFTILPRGWQTDKTGPWVAYPTISANFRFNVSKTFTTNANQSNNAIPGLELTVANTFGAATGDSGIVTTYKRGGEEPRVGDTYFVSYVYEKQDFSTAFYSKVSTIEKVFGAATPDNPVSLAAYLAILNGAVIIGVKQVKRADGESQGSINAYRDAVVELEGVLPGQVQPDIITLMRGDSTDLYMYLKRSCEIQSSIRYRAERTAILGVSAGTNSAGVTNMAQTLGNTRVRLVYPDMATLNVQDGLGSIKEYLIDGPYLAAALAGSVVSPNTDVATPWTGRRLVGFTQLARQLDAVQANQIAVKGVTILQDQAPFIKVRHGLTTDMTNILTKLPTIIMIADEIQRQSRDVLESFIGLKFLPGILGQIEGRLSMMLKAAVSAQIITAYTGVKANVSVDDATTCEVEAFYSPVFPLLYILVSFHMRSSL